MRYSRHALPLSYSQPPLSSAHQVYALKISPPPIIVDEEDDISTRRPGSQAGGKKVGGITLPGLIAQIKQYQTKETNARPLSELMSGAGKPVAAGSPAKTMPGGFFSRKGLKRNSLKRIKSHVAGRGPKVKKEKIPATYSEFINVVGKKRAQKADKELLEELRMIEVERLEMARREYEMEGMPNAGTGLVSPRSSLRNSLHTAPSNSRTSFSAQRSRGARKLRPLSSPTPYESSPRPMRPAASPIRLR